MFNNISDVLYIIYQIVPTYLILKDERTSASRVLQGPPPQERPKISAENRMVMVEKIRKALYASKIVSYAQGSLI